MKSQENIPLTPLYSYRSTMSQPTYQPQSNGAAVTVSNEVMVGAVIFLFLVVVFVFFLYLYARRRLQAHPRLRTFRFVPEQQRPNSRLGLDPAVLGALPVTVFKSEESLECAVCLSEVSHGERVRMLPKCGHGFHVECIDMWFHSHSTCPLCRSPVVVVVPSETPTQEVPTNVLFWGNSDRVSQRAGGSGMLVIEIPSRQLPAATEEEQRSPASARLRSLVRLLSRGKRETGDVEQGSSSALKSPKPSKN